MLFLFGLAGANIRIISDKTTGSEKNPKFAVHIFIRND